MRDVWSEISGVMMVMMMMMSLVSTAAVCPLPRPPIPSLTVAPQTTFPPDLPPDLHPHLHLPHQCGNSEQ